MFELKLETANLQRVSVVLPLVILAVAVRVVVFLIERKAARRGAELARAARNEEVVGLVEMIEARNADLAIAKLEIDVCRTNLLNMTRDKEILAECNRCLYIQIKNLKLVIKNHKLDVDLFNSGFHAGKHLCEDDNHARLLDECFDKAFKDGFEQGKRFVQDEIREAEEAEEVEEEVEEVEEEVEEEIEEEIEEEVEEEVEEEEEFQ